MMLMCVIVVTLLSGVFCEDTETVRTLKEQVSALLEDVSLLSKNSELTALREELTALRQEVEELRRGNRAATSSTGNQQKNDHLTVQWLATAVSELRGEVTEVAAAHNTSVELQRREEINSELVLLRGDMSSVRRDLEELHVAQEKGAVALAQAQQDVMAVRSQTQNVAGLCADTLTQFQNAQTEWSIALKALKKYGREDPAYEGGRKRRHQRGLCAQLAETFCGDQAHLGHRVHRLEKQMKQEVVARVSALELASRSAAKTVFNMTRKLAGLDKLHHSMLQMLESVETLENELDRSVPDLQREISKMEFNMAQLTSSIALVREEQGKQRSSLKALGAGVSHRSSPDPPKTVFPEANDNFNISTIWKLVQELSVMQTQYQQIVTSLPQDCGAVRGPSGLYLMSPGSLGTPLLLSCDQTTAPGGWVVVQRRVDGSEDFDRKWSEYATGFGSPSGEFWLGNEALHHLTADNCSSLRVDLRDIYGKNWVAEYDEFSVSGATDGYRLHVAGYRGNASDALEYQNRMQFSAVDSDRDISNTNCAANYEGGWWFSHCQHANLNGRYNLGLTWFDASKNEWIAVAWSEMRVRRTSRCDKLS
ncbi:Protein scabrous [Zootermopsis nevadensis]|uniref:Protein scabrous n=2 Tax=Zootermopsis nevadensis TaxID=136037 RepID=A0A067RJR4_ZOONE|nr:Protein scabrous [Zootermopsis nevadensis]